MIDGCVPSWLDRHATMRTPPSWSAAEIDGRFTHTRVKVERALDLAKLDTVASALHHPIAPPDVEIPVGGIPADDVAGVVPAQAVAIQKHRAVDLRPVPVALEHRRTADVQQALVAVAAGSCPSLSSTSGAQWLHAKPMG